MPRALPLAFASAIALALAAACGAGAPARPNVLLVTFDTTRPDHLGAYGYARPTSPNVDALAARGVRFADAWSHAPETGPSLATVLTSRRAPVTGVRGNAEALDDTLPTLATAAKAADYRTAAFVSTALLRRDVCGFGRGFDVYDDEMTDPCFGHDRAQRIGPRTAERAVEWMRSRGDGPWFCWVHLYDAHGPYEPPEPTPELDATRALVPSEALRAEWIPRYQKVGDSLDAADYRDRYDREIAVADRAFGRLLEAADAAGTLVVVHADHGEALGEDGYWFRHGSLLHDAALRVPWIVAGPGVVGGRAIESPVRLIDLTPTVLALAGLPALPGAEGTDLSAAVRGGEAPAPRPLVAEARKREIVRDATGIDVLWKLRIRTPERDVTLPGADPDSAFDPSWPIARDWLLAPPRAPRPQRPAAARDPDTERAMEGLGYK